MKTVLRICFVQTLQMVKVNRWPGEQRRFYKFKARGQNKISFSNLLPGSLVKIAIGICESCEILQGNGSETTSTGIGPAGSSERASKFVAGSLKPRFT